MNGIEQQLSFMTQALSLLDASYLEKFLDVCASDEAVLLAAYENRRAHIEIPLQPVEERNELILHRAVELVYRLTRQVDGDDCNTAADLSREGVGRSHQSRSTTIAKPSPPAAQTVIKPN